MYADCNISNLLVLFSSLHIINRQRILIIIIFIAEIAAAQLIRFAEYVNANNILQSQAWN